MNFSCRFFIFRLIVLCFICLVCGSYLTGRQGIVKSPNYPENYPINSDCEWIIRARPGRTIQFQFMNLNIPSPSVQCEDNYIKVCSVPLISVLPSFNIPIGIFFNMVSLIMDRVLIPQWFWLIRLKVCTRMADSVSLPFPLPETPHLTTLGCSTLATEIRLKASRWNIKKLALGKWKVAENDKKIS